jgi:hypothetical protein
MSARDGDPSAFFAPEFCILGVVRGRVAPENDFDSYDAAFQGIIGSVRLDK